MGRNSGGGGGSNPYARGGSGTIAVDNNGKVIPPNGMKHIEDTAESLDSLPHREVVKQLNRAISRYETVMGIRERKIMVADVGPGAYGVTFVGTDGSQGIYLNKDFFAQHRNAIETTVRNTEYASGFKNVTNRPIQHTMTHELAHATWASRYVGTNQRAAGVEIKRLYDEWKRDRNKQGYGAYGKSNVDEFWAEVVTKAIHGKADTYTKQAVAIAKKYNL